MTQDGASCLVLSGLWLSPSLHIKGIGSYQCAEGGSSFCKAAAERQVTRRDARHRRHKLPRMPEA